MESALENCIFHILAMYEFLHSLFRGDDEAWIFYYQMRVRMSDGRHFFTSGQRDDSSDWNASLPGIVASSL